MMNRYYTKKSYSPVNRTQHIGAQSAERESFRETRQIRTPRGRKRKVWKCDECGIVLKDNQGMLRRHPNHILCPPHLIPRHEKCLSSFWYLGIEFYLSLTEPGCGDEVKRYDVEVFTDVVIVVMDDNAVTM